MSFGGDVFWLVHAGAMFTSSWSAQIEGLLGWVCARIKMASLSPMGLDGPLPWLTGPSCALLALVPRLQLQKSKLPGLIRLISFSFY